MSMLKAMKFLLNWLMQLSLSRITVFFNHRGIDSIRIAGAFLRNLTSRGGLQGGSTLTQQLIKLTYFSTSSSDQTIARKAQEAWLAIQLERTATKQEIFDILHQ